MLNTHHCSSSLADTSDTARCWGKVYKRRATEPNLTMQNQEASSWRWVHTHTCIHTHTHVSMHNTYHTCANAHTYTYHILLLQYTILCHPNLCFKLSIGTVMYNTVLTYTQSLSTTPTCSCLQTHAPLHPHAPNVQTPIGKMLLKV